MDSPTIKPGYLTTEFWLPVVLTVATLLKLAGVDLEGLDIEGLVATTVAFVASVVSVVSYVRSRAKVKSAQLQAAAVSQAVRENPGTPLTVTLGKDF